MTTQEEAIQILADGHKRVRDLIATLPAEAVNEGGMGSGSWSPKDLIGHLGFWERAALEAVDAWSSGGAAPIDRLLYRGIDSVNRDALRAIRAADLEDLIKEADWAHDALVDYIDSISADLWGSPPTARHVHSIGESLGRILLGPQGLFTHYQDHIKDLETFVAGRVK